VSTRQPIKEGTGGIAVGKGCQDRITDQGHNVRSL
jgi:hypothetical protein